MGWEQLIPIAMGLMQGAQTDQAQKAQRQKEQQDYERALAEARSRAEAYTEYAYATNKQATRLISATEDSLEDDFYSILETQRQVNQESVLDKNSRMRQGIRERAIMRNALASSGITGGTLGQRDKIASRIQQAADLGVIEATRSNKMRDQEFRKKQARAQAQEKFNVAEGMLDESKARLRQATSVVYPILDQGPAWMDTANVVMSAASGYFQGSSVIAKYKINSSKPQSKADEFSGPKNSSGTDSKNQA